MRKAFILVLMCVLSFALQAQRSVDIIMGARSLTEAGRPDPAIAMLTNAINSTREYRLYIERAEAYLNKGDYSSAISDYNEANKLSPACGEYGLARIYSLKGDAATATYHLGLHLGSPYKKSEKEVMLDPAFGTIENRSEWRQFWKKDWYTFTEKSISEIEYNISAGKTDESKTILSELKASDTDNNDLLYAEALTYLGSHKYGESVKAVSILLSKAPSNEKYLRLMADAQVNSLNFAGASVTYSQLINQNVADAKLLMMRAECYRKTGETVKYLSFYPENLDALSLAGRVEAMSGDNIKALEYFSKNLKLHPNDSQCYIDRANSYFVSRSWDWAIKDYSMSLDLNPGNSDIWLNKGIALLNTGNSSDACHDFRKALSLGNKRAAEFISNNCIK
jgi:tetratricopeptide (TPR) repeat protein